MQLEPSFPSNLHRAPPADQSGSTATVAGIFSLSEVSLKPIKLVTSVAEEALTSLDNLSAWGVSRLVRLRYGITAVQQHFVTIDDLGVTAMLLGPHLRILAN